MYTYELENLLKGHNYHIPSNIYIEMITNSPQVDHVKYNPYGDYFELWTDDGYYAKFTIYLEEK